MFQTAWRDSTAGVGNLSLVAGQKQTMRYGGAH